MRIISLAMAVSIATLAAAVACSSVDVTSPASSTGDGPANGQGASTRVAPEQLEAAGNTANIGFNNAAQVVTDSDGTQHYVFVTGSRVVMHGSATGSAADVEPSAVSSGQGRVSLTAIAAADGIIVIGWTETARGDQTSVYLSESADGGATWSPPRLLEAGASGLSLAASGGTVVAAWFVGDEAASEIHVASRDRESGEWTSPIRVDGSDAAPLWPAVAASGESVWVTWRDNRDGAYHVYLRRSTDGGATWSSEQEVTRTNTGDPTVCAGDNGVVWLAHHGRGKITVLRSTDGGATFAEPAVVGNGWFPRLSCEADGDMILGWEQSEGMDPKADDSKQAAYATGSADGTIGHVTVLAETAGTCASVTVRGDGYADAVWVDKGGSDSGAPALEGELWHAVVEVAGG